MSGGGDREAEAQAKKEEGASNDPDSRAAALLKQHWCVGLRVIELVLAVLATGLVAGAFHIAQPNEVVSFHQITLIYSSYSAFIIITGVLVIARLFGETVGWKTSIAFSVLGGLLFAASAAVIFYDWNKAYYMYARPNKSSYHLLLSSGIIAILEAAIFLTHAFFTFRKEADY